MREKKQVVRELSQAVEQMMTLRAKEGATRDEIRAAQDSVERLTDELNQINLAEAAERATVAAQQEQTPDLKQLARRFSMAKPSLPVS